MTSQVAQDVLNLLNKINKTIERSKEKINLSLPSDLFSDDEKDLLRLGKHDLEHHGVKFQIIKGRVERFIITEFALTAGLLRVMSMQSELETEVYECSICLVAILKVDKAWSCSSCYHVLHLACVKEHALHSIQTYLLDAIEGNAPRLWNCPVCRHPKDSHPDALHYTCFCGAVYSPKPTARVAAHGCGRRCQRTPRCNMECHPAACPVAK